MQIAMIGFIVLASAACFFYTLELMNKDQKKDSFPDEYRDFILPLFKNKNRVLGKIFITKNKLMEYFENIPTPVLGREYVEQNINPLKGEEIVSLFLWVDYVGLLTIQTSDNRYGKTLSKLGGGLPQDLNYQLDFWFNSDRVKLIPGLTIADILKLIEFNFVERRWLPGYLPEDYKKALEGLPWTDVSLITEDFDLPSTKSYANAPGNPRWFLEMSEILKGREIGRDRVEFLGKAKNFEKIMIQRETNSFINELRKINKAGLNLYEN